MPTAVQTDHWRVTLCSRLSVCSFVRPFVCYQKCEHNILKMNEPILMQIVTNGPQCKGCKGMKISTLGVRKSKIKVIQTEIGHGNPFRRDFSRTLRWMFTKSGRHMSGTHVYYGQCLLCDNSLEAKGPRKVKVTNLEAWQRHHFWPAWVE